MTKESVTKKLFEVAEVFDGPHATPKTVNEGPIFLGITALQDGQIKLSETRHVTDEDFKQWTRRVKPQADDVVFSYETKLGEAAIIPAGLECCLGRRMGLIRFNRETVMPQFFLYQYLSPSYQVFLDSRTIRGATVNRISIKDFPSFPVFVPPLSEQQRIVGILDEAFDGLATAKANAEKNIQNARALFESHLQSIFIQRKQGWHDCQLSSLCHEITVGHVGSMKAHYRESGIPFLRSQNIRAFEVVTDNVVFIDDAFHGQLKKSRLRPGDVAIVRTGFPGTAAVIPLELSDSNCSDLVIVRPMKAVNPHFLAAFFNSAFGKQLVLGKIVGAAQKHFNVNAAKEVVLHLPPISEQENFISVIGELRTKTQRLELTCQKKIDALDALKKSLLHQAFSGQL